MKQSVEHGRTMTGREDKAIAVGPGRVGGVVLEKAGPQHSDNIGCA